MSVEALLEFSRRRYEMIRNWRELVSRLKDVVKRILPDAKVYVFGSVVEGRYTAASDIDVLVINVNILHGE